MLCPLHPVNICVACVKHNSQACQFGMGENMCQVVPFFRTPGIYEGTWFAPV